MLTEMKEINENVVFKWAFPEDAGTDEEKQKHSLKLDITLFYSV